MILVGDEYSQPLDPEVSRALVHVGGLNLYGEPNYRFMWGWSRQEKLGPFLKLRYDAPLRHLERWHLEMWVPPSSYGDPAIWDAPENIVIVNGDPVNTLGEYPHRGEYERLLTFENFTTHEPMPPTVEWATEAVRRHQRMRARTSAEIRSQIEQRLSDQDCRFRKQASEKLGALEAAFPFKTWIPVSGPQTATSRRESWLN